MLYLAVCTVLLTVVINIQTIIHVYVHVKYGTHKGEVGRVGRFVDSGLRLWGHFVGLLKLIQGCFL